MTKELTTFIQHWKRSNEHQFSVTNQGSVTRFDKTFKDGSSWHSFWHWDEGYRYTILDESKGHHPSPKIPIKIDAKTAYDGAADYNLRKFK